MGVFWIRLPTSSQRDEIDPSQLSVDAAHLDFGAVWEDPAFVWTLPIKNRHTRDIHILGFASSCLCLSVEPRSLVVPAGGMSEVRLTLNLAYRTPQSSRTSQPASSGRPTPTTAGKQRLVSDFSVEISPKIQGLHGGTLSGSPWKVKGHVRKALSLSTYSIWFADGLVRGQYFGPRVVEVTAYEPLRHLSANVDPSLAQVSVSRVKRPDDAVEQYQLSIQPREDLPVGPFEFTVELNAIKQSGSTLPTFPLRVSGKVVDDIRARPLSVIFGARTVGETVEETVTLLSSSDKSFSVERIGGGSEALTVQPIEMQPEAAGAHRKWVFRITKVIEQLGDCSNEIRFFVRVEGTDAAVIVPVRVSYLGIAK